MYKFGEKILIKENGQIHKEYEESIFIHYCDDGKKGLICVHPDDIFLFVDRKRPFRTIYRMIHKPLPKKKYTPFTIEDAHLFRGKWIKYRTDNKNGSEIPSGILITAYNNVDVYNGEESYSYEEAFDMFLFEDDTPFGKEVEE